MIIRSDRSVGVIAQHTAAVAFALLPELQRHLSRVVTIDVASQVFSNVLVGALRDLVDAIAEPVVAEVLLPGGHLNRLRMGDGCELAAPLERLEATRLSELVHEVICLLPVVH